MMKIAARFERIKSGDIKGINTSCSFVIDVSTLDEKQQANGKLNRNDKNNSDKRDCILIYNIIVKEISTLLLNLNQLHNEITRDNEVISKQMCNVRWQTKDLKLQAEVFETEFHFFGLKRSSIIHEITQTDFDIT